VYGCDKGFKDNLEADIKFGFYLYQKWYSNLKRRGDSMKNILDIQKDIRELNAQMNEFSKKMQLIINDLGAARDEATDIAILDFGMIKTVSRHIIFSEHPLQKLEDAYACKLYMAVLANLIRIDAEGVVEKLIFIQWILEQTKIDIPLEELIKSSYEIDKNSYSELLEVIVKDYRLYLIVDTMIVANIRGQGNEEAMIYIASLCAVLGFDKEQVKTMSLITRIVLCQEAEKLKKSDVPDVMVMAKKFIHYLGQDLLRNEYVLQRKIVVEQVDDWKMHFRWKAKQGDIVEKGDVIATVLNNPIKANSSGKMFQFRDNCIYYGVIANELDSKDSIKSWVKKMRRG